MLLVLPLNNVTTGIGNFITFSETSFNFRIGPGTDGRRALLFSPHLRSSRRSASGPASCAKRNSDMRLRAELIVADQLYHGNRTKASRIDRGAARKAAKPIRPRSVFARRLAVRLAVGLPPWRSISKLNCRCSGADSAGRSRRMAASAGTVIP